MKCPHCGYCPSCGRANAAPYYPYYPYWSVIPYYHTTYPNWGTYTLTTQTTTGYAPGITDKTSTYTAGATY